MQSGFLTRILVNLVSDYQCLRFFLRAVYPLIVYMTHRQIMHLPHVDWLGMTRSASTFHLRAVEDEIERQEFTFRQLFGILTLIK